MGKVGGARPGGGRKPGSLNRRHVEVLAGALAEGITPVEYMLGVLRDEQADPKARAWAAEKSAPYLHPRPAPIERTVAIGLPDTSTPEGIGRALDAILQAIANAELSPAEGQSLISVIEARRKAIETADLAARIATLERAVPKRA